jgi:uncharacterized membrane protein
MAGVALFVGVLVLLAACLAAIETLMARFTRLHSVELVLQALDILSRTASRFVAKRFSKSTKIRW